MTAATEAEAYADLFASIYRMEGESVVIDYVAPIRLYLQEECIVLYGGTNETVIFLLDEELREPFAYNDY